MSKLKLYRSVLLLSILANLIVGVFIFVSPDGFTNFAGQPMASPSTWPRHWGMQLWAINFLYIPGFKDPIGHRWPNWCGIVIRLVFAAFFFTQGDGFNIMGIYDGSSGLLLLLTYLPALSEGKASTLRAGV
ncbi:MAG TPA: hypothetical protein VH436_29740 [Vicinamibacterales bacterium]|jgi:hypothetical protein